MREIRSIYGIDFSGARDAGNKIWITRGVPDGEGLVILWCWRARDLPDSGRDLEACLPALLNLVDSDPYGAFGFDFPFGLPAPLVEEDTWEDFVLAFPGRYGGPDDLRSKCMSGAGGRELRRDTDREARTPFSPYNLRLYRQTYHGISGVLRPLVRDGGACFLPFQEPVVGKPWILEVCPASTLRRYGLYQGYKYPRRREDRPEARSGILREIERVGNLRYENERARESAIEDRHGDALDSIIAATATHRAVRDAVIPRGSCLWKTEGYVYV